MSTEAILQHKIEIIEAILAQKPVEYRPIHGGFGWRLIDHNQTYFIHWDEYLYRLAQPADKIAKGHNPLNLTESVVEVDKGWRLLDTDEIKKRSLVVVALADIERFCPNNGWETRWSGDIAVYTYRTKLTREQLSIFDIPLKKRVPCTAEDFPPGTVIKSPSNVWCNVARVTDTGVMLAGERERERSYQDIAEMCQNPLRSLDGGKTWLPCYREE